MVIEFPEYVERLIDEGIEVTIKKNEKLGVYFDLNLRAQSHMHLYKSGDNWRIAMRYGDDFEISGFDDLLERALDAYRARDFIGNEWLALLVKEGLLTQHVETNVTYR